MRISAWSLLYVAFRLLQTFCYLSSSAVSLFLGRILPCCVRCNVDNKGFGSAPQLLRVSPPTPTCAPGLLVSLLLLPAHASSSSSKPSDTNDELIEVFQVIHSYPLT